MSSNKSNRIPFPHPGETIREDFMKPLSMGVNKLALELRVPACHADDRDCQRKAGHHRGYSTSSSTLFQYDTEILGEPAKLPTIWRSLPSQRPKRSRARFTLAMRPDTLARLERDGRSGTCPTKQHQEIVAAREEIKIL